MIFTFLHLGILVTSMFAIQSQEQYFLNSLIQQNIQSIAQSPAPGYNHSAYSRDKNSENIYARALDAMGIVKYQSAEKTAETSQDTWDNRSLNHCKTLVFRTLKSLPSEAVAKLKNLTLQLAYEGRRGWGGGSTIIIRCSGVTDEELVSVLIHEMGHITDTGLLQGGASAGTSEFQDGNNPIYQNDQSLEFYRISFESEKKIKAGSSLMDFVSGYAATDPFEDFAESYNFYVLHGNEFRHVKQQNEALQKKYDFLKTRIFKGFEFDSGNSNEESKIFERDYDTTVLNYDLKKFFEATNIAF